MYQPDSKPEESKAETECTIEDFSQAIKMSGQLKGLTDSYSATLENDHQEEFVKTIGVKCIQSKIASFFKRV